MTTLVIVRGPKGHAWSGAAVEVLDRTKDCVVTDLGPFRRDRYGTFRLESDPAFQIDGPAKLGPE